MFRFSYFSWIRSVLLDDQACPFFVHVRLRSFRSMTPPPFFLTIFVSFMCAFSHICNDCVVFGSICFVSCLHVLCSSRWPSLSSFFVHVRLRSFGSMTRPWIFWPFLSCFTSSCVVSVRISVCLFCVPSTCTVLCPVFGFPSRCNLFSICCLARLLSFCPGYVFRPVFYFLLNWYQKTKFTSLRQYHFICTVL